MAIEGIEGGGVRTPPGGMPGGDAQLHALALARPELAWRPGMDIAASRNAHATNLRDDLADALRGDYDWLEADVRVGPDGRPVLQHERHEPRGMALDDWLSVVAPSGRGVKLDIKEQQALSDVIDAVREAGIEDHRLIINVPVLATAKLVSIRRAFPDAIINLSPDSDAKLTATDLVQLQLASRIVGGRVMFPIRQDMLTSGVVHALQPYGRIAVWNTPGLTNPDSDTVRGLRELGVDGMIDLREPDGLGQRVSAFAAESAAKLFGWEPILRVLDSFELL